MSAIRRLESRLRAWRSFRDLAHAARSLAAAQGLRWSAAVAQAAAHARLTREIAGEWASPPTPARVTDLLALGTDLGLCGRLNRLVADALVDRAATTEAPVIIVVGQRLRVELGERLASAPTISAPSSAPAALDLAGRLEGLLVALAPASALALVLILAGETSASGAPVIVTWDDASPTPAARRPEDPASPPVSSRVPRLHRSPRLLLSPASAAREPAASLRLHARLVHGLAVAGASEADARLRTMSRAVDASDRRIDEHERLLRKHRQESTTQEMLEARGGRPADAQPTA